MGRRSVEGAIARDVTPLHDAFFSAKRIGGLTHNLYRYPARFSPEFVRVALDAFSSPGDLVLDPFMGGGTSAVESLVAGRRFVGFDLNPLSVLLARTKTTPLSRRDRVALRSWIERSFGSLSEYLADDPRLRNAPESIAGVLAGPVGSITSLESTRQQDAARTVLLGVGQWAIDGRRTPASAVTLRSVATQHLERLFLGLDAIAGSARQQGIRPSEMPRRRVLRSGAARSAASSRGLNRIAGRARVVVTSPPYPGVHVLYHRWQVQGRSETPMPYWIADLQDGLGPKHYTMGGRSEVGQASYFNEMRETWTALRRLLAPDAVVIQLIAFSRPEVQVQRYRAMMGQAGFESVPELEPTGPRDVPNRRWYYRIEPDRLQAKESLMVHRLSR